MEHNEGQELFLRKYLQRQENIFLDFFRKNIESDVKVELLSNSLQETQKQLELQTDLVQQATKGLESVTIERDYFSQKTKEQETELLELRPIKKKYEDIFREYQAQIQEMNKLHEELQSFKQKQKINKNNPKTTLSSDEF